MNIPVRKRLQANLSTNDYQQVCWRCSHQLERRGKANICGTSRGGSPRLIATTTSWPSNKFKRTVKNAPVAATGGESRTNSKTTIPRDLATLSRRVSPISEFPRDFHTIDYGERKFEAKKQSSNSTRRRLFAAGNVNRTGILSPHFRNSVNLGLPSMRSGLRQAVPPAQGVFRKRAHRQPTQLCSPSMGPGQIRSYTSSPVGRLSLAVVTPIVLIITRTGLQ